MDEVTSSRKLNVNEGFIVSKILKDMNAKSYIEYLLRTMEKYKISNSKAQIELEKLEKTKTLEFIENWKKENIKSKQEIDNLLGIDMIAFVIENMDMARDSVFELISSYKEISKDEIGKQDLDFLIDSLMEMFRNGLPSILTKMLKKNTEGNLDFLTKANVLRQ